jgi:monoamine oxidase
VLFRSEGLQNLFLKIVEQNEIDVLKGEPVVHILQDENRVYVSTPSRKLRAKYILLTIPPQKYKHINFEPEMPVDHMNMVDNFIQGSVTKVIAVYSRPWWREKGFSGLISSLTGPFDLVIDSSPTTNEKGVLVGLVTSSRSKGLKGKDLRAVFSNHLMNCFGESEPMSDFLVFDWNGSPYTLGGYSSRRRINEWHLCQDFLQRPLGRIYFSGSETALEWRGYIEGALESAERQAAKLVTVLKSS